MKRASGEQAGPKLVSPESAGSDAIGGYRPVDTHHLIFYEPRSIGRSRVRARGGGAAARPLPNDAAEKPIIRLFRVYALKSQVPHTRSPRDTTPVVTVRPVANPCFKV